MANPTKKMIEVFNMMKSGKAVDFDKMVDTLGCKPVTAMVLICALRRDCGAEIESIRDGRKVVAYRLDNADAIASKMVSGAKSSKPAKAAKTKNVAAKKVAAATSTKAAKTKTAAVDDGSIPVLDSNLEISEISEREFDDIKSQLGLA